MIFKYTDNLPFFTWLQRGLGEWAELMLTLCLLTALWVAAALLIQRGPRGAAKIYLNGLKGLLEDLIFISPRRVLAIARLAFSEAIRKKVIIVFIVFSVTMLFASWFLDESSSNPARVYITTVMTATGYLVLLLALFVGSMSIPEDIENRTLFTVVTKPVRRSEIVLGRMLGFTSIGGLLLLMMWGVSYFFVIGGLQHTHTLTTGEQQQLLENIKTQLASGGQPSEQTYRTTRVNGHEHEVTLQLVRRQDGKNVLVRKPTGKTTLRQTTSFDHNHQHEFVLPIPELPEGVKNATGPESLVGFNPALGTTLEPENQLRGRSAVWGVLRFTDRSGRAAEEEAPFLGKGINVGDVFTYRSFIEGNTGASAVWRFGVPDVETLQKRYKEGLPLELVLSVFRTRKGETNKFEDRIPPVRGALEVWKYFAPGEKEAIKKIKDEQGKELDRIKKEGTEEEYAAAQKSYDALLRREQLAFQLENGKFVPLPYRSRNGLASRFGAVDKVPVEYVIPWQWTVKSNSSGRQFLENPTPGAIDETTYHLEDFIFDFNGNKARGRTAEQIAEEKAERAKNDMLIDTPFFVTFRVRCLDTEFYFGVAQNDMYIKAGSSSFAWNFFKGYLGIAMQLTLITAYAVMFSTFLNGPVAFFATAATFLGGIFFEIIKKIADGTLHGTSTVSGGPFESFYRLYHQMNTVQKLEKSLTTDVMYLLDGASKWMMDKISYGLPDIQYFNFSEYVASGYDIPFTMHLLKAFFVTLGYLIPLLFAGYLFLKVREVAK